MGGERLPPLRRVHWKKSARIVSSRFPTVTLFDQVADPADLDSAFLFESVTNPRVKQEVGLLSLVPRKDRLSGPGTTPVMAAFTHPNIAGTRFSDGSYGVYYAAGDLDTAIAETVFHRERYLKASHAPAVNLEMRVYYAEIQARLHDLRGLQSKRFDIYDPDPTRYGPAQRLGRMLRDRDSFGIAYDSVRRQGGECVAILRPPAVAPVRQGPHLCYHYDGERIAYVSQLRVLR